MQARFNLCFSSFAQVKSSLATAIVPYTPALEVYDNNQCTGVVPEFLLQISACDSSQKQSFQCTSSWENPESVTICQYGQSDCQGACSKDITRTGLCSESSPGIYRKLTCSSYEQITTSTKVIAPTTAPKVVDHPVSAGVVAAAILTPLVIVVIVAVVIFFVIRKKSSNGTLGGAGSGNTSSSYGSV